MWSGHLIWISQTLRNASETDLLSASSYYMIISVTVSVNSYVGMRVERGEFFIPDSQLNIFKPHVEWKLDLDISKITHYYYTY